MRGLNLYLFYTFFLVIASFSCGEEKPSQQNRETVPSKDTEGEKNSSDVIEEKILEQNVEVDSSVPVDNGETIPSNSNTVNITYEEVNSKILQETCGNNACHGPESFRIYVDNEENFRKVVTKVKKRIIDTNRKHYFKRDVLSQEDYDLLDAYTTQVEKELLNQ